MTDAQTSPAPAGGSSLLHVDRRGDVAVLRMEHGKVNALDLELLERLESAVTEVADAAAVVLTGTGSSFSAGVDLRRVVQEDVEYTHRFLDALTRALLAVFRHPRPVVAAVNGHAIAGGGVLAAAADVRLMSGGSIGLTELRVGVPFPTAALEIVRYAVGPAVHQLALYADLYDAERAERLGLVQGRCESEQLLDEAVERANRLAALGAEAYSFTKQQLHGIADDRIGTRAANDDADVHRQWTSPQGRAAIESFLAQLDAAAARRR